MYLTTDQSKSSKNATALRYTKLRASMQNKTPVKG